MKLVFMGTPDFSVPCLEALVAAGHTVTGVFTQPDKPVGRKAILTPPPVKERATALGIPVYQPDTLRDGEALRILEEHRPDCIVVVAYGKFLPQEILDLPPYGCVNVHASLLPRHRGASPIQWAIVCGDAQTGVTTMQMDAGMDTGAMLEVAETAITPQDTGETLHDRLSAMGAKLILSTLAGLEAGTLTPKPQPEEGVTKAPIITREMGHLDFTQPTKAICNLVRGFTPWPSTYGILAGKRLKVFAACPAAGKGAPGTVLESDGHLIVACGDGAVELTDLQLEGARRMPVPDLLRGHPIPIGIKLQ